MCIAVLLLTACAMSEEEAAAARHKQCVEQGFKPGTPAFTACEEAQVRKQAERQQELRDRSEQMRQQREFDALQPRIPR